MKLNDANKLDDKLQAILNTFELRVQDCAEDTCDNFLIVDTVHRQKRHICYRNENDNSYNWIITCQNIDCESEKNSCCAKHIHRHFVHTFDDVWLCNECYKNVKDEIFEIINIQESCHSEIPYTFSYSDYKITYLCNGKSCICSRDHHRDEYYEQYKISRSINDKIKQSLN